MCGLFIVNFSRTIASLHSLPFARTITGLQSITTRYFLYSLINPTPSNILPTVDTQFLALATLGTADDLDGVAIELGTSTPT